MYAEVLLPPDNYQAGFTIGKCSREIMQSYVQASEPWRALKAWIGSRRLKNMESAARAAFPQYVDELTGIADGCELPYSHIFLWNCRGDLLPLAREGCTTVYVPSPAGILLGHNEDGDPGLRNYCFISKRASQGDHLGFTSFTYPASINGHAFAVNDAGLTQLINNIRSLEYGDGVPRQILSRAVLDCRSLDDALAVFRGARRAGSFHHTLAQVGSRDVFSVEYTPDHVSVQRLDAPSGHTNHFIHPRLLDAKQRITPSSAARRVTVDQLCRKLPAAPGMDDIGRMLFSTDNPDLPIYRTNPHDPDGENTFATALFLIKAHTLQARLYGDGGKEQAFACELSENIV